MKNGRIVAITGFLIILALWGYSYYGKNAPPPSTQDMQTPVNSVAPVENKALVSSTAPTEKEAAVSSTATDQSQASPSSSVNPDNNVPKNSAATPEIQAAANPETAVANKAPLNSAAAIEQAKNNGESMWLLFRSATCIPCIEMQKIFDQLQSDYKGKVRFIAIDVNDRNNKALIKTWKIQYIPTTFIIDGSGKVSCQNVGVIPVEDLKKELNRVVK